MMSRWRRPIAVTVALVIVCAVLSCTARQQTTIYDALPVDADEWDCRSADPAPDAGHVCALKPEAVMKYTRGFEVADGGSLEPQVVPSIAHGGVR